MAGRVGGVDQGRPRLGRAAGDVRRHRVPVRPRCCSSRARCRSPSTPRTSSSAAPDSSVQFDAPHNTGLAVEASAAGIGAARAAVGAALTRAWPRPRPTCSARCRATARPRCGRCRIAARHARGEGDGRAGGDRDARSADGLFDVEGTVLVDGTTPSLDYTNIPTTVTDAQISVSISASCYAASSVSAVTWTATS